MARRISPKDRISSPCRICSSSARSEGFFAGYVEVGGVGDFFMGGLCGDGAGGVIAAAQCRVIAQGALADRMLAHRLADLRARTVGELPLERARAEACVEDAFDGASLVGVVAHRVLKGCDDVLGRPSELQRKKMIEFGASVALALAQSLAERLGRLAPTGKPLEQQCEIVPAPLARPVPDRVRRRVGSARGRRGRRFVLGAKS